VTDDLSVSRLAKELGVDLPPDARAWLGSDKLPEAPATRFDQLIAPSSLLDPHSGAIWGGQMLPDTLPVVADGAGNALCLRFGFDGTVAEVIEWNHEGGNWKSFGQSIAEALVLDASLTLLDQTDSDEQIDEFAIEDSFAYAEWATTWIPELDLSVLRVNAGELRELPSRLVKLGVAPVAIAQWNCRRHLTNRLERLCRQVGGGKIARSLGVTWAEFRPWLSEPRLIPENQKEPLSTLTTVPFNELVRQDWVAAAAEAQAVLDIRADLAWPFAVLGRFKSEQDDIAGAVDFYVAGLEASRTTEDFVSSWKTKFDSQTKFIPNALRGLNTPLPQAKEEYLQLFFSRDAAKSVRNHWIQHGEAAESKQLYELAYRCYYNAGWDLPVQNEIEEVLDRLQVVAVKAGFDALARLTRHHRLAMA
jgi:hypothetical protein